MQEQELIRLIKDWIVERRRESSGVDENVDLLASGTLDSMGFIELLAYLESATGRTINLQDLDAEVFTSIEGLARSLTAKNTAGMTL